VAGATQAELAEALNSWTAGVTLVTVADGHDDVGATVSAFCPVSTEPPLVLLSLMDGSYLAEVFGRPDAPATAPATATAPAPAPATEFAVVLLAAGQRVLSGRFAAAGRPGVRLMLGDVPHRRGPVSGALIVEGGLAALECSAEQVQPAGDHLLVLARVTGVPYVSEAGEPLIRFRRRYVSP
jgi:flavin reductase (DIM6/NTAB) family NADH-FMN oxidoreductase RutF